MSVDAAGFLLLYPEFTPAGTALITAKIAEAEEQVSDTFATDRRDYIVALQTAAILAESPQGRNARLDPKGRNIYAERLQDEQWAHACAFNRIG
jgi:hypothetical protein